MAEPDNIVLQYLRSIREQLDTLNERQLEMMQRIGALEVQLANLTTQWRISRFVSIASMPVWIGSSAVSA